MDVQRTTPLYKVYYYSCVSLNNMHGMMKRIEKEHAIAINKKLWGHNS